MSNLYGVIDIGSNSVRLMITDGSFADKMSVMTRLAEGMQNGLLTSVAMERTAEAVVFLKNAATVRNVKEIFVFATAAVRSAQNKGEFCDLVKKTSGLTVDVISGEKEAEIGYKGALKGDGALVDVGGASSEVIIVKCGKPAYIKSVGIGAVVIKDACGQDRGNAERFIAEKLKQYGNLPKTYFWAVGGTATTVAAMLLSLKKYDAERVQGFYVDKKELSALADKLYSLSVEERKKLVGLQPQRAEIIAGGVLLLLRITEMLKADGFTVSENDNLNGYFVEKVVNCEKKN